MIIRFSLEESKRIKALGTGEVFNIRGVLVKREPRTFVVTFGQFSDMKLRFGADGVNAVDQITIKVA